MSNIEKGGQEYRERESEVNPTIRLEIFRHDQPAPAGEGETDSQRRLTPQGREHAQKAGQEKNPAPDMGVAYGSPRLRSQETAYRQLLADQAFVNQETTVEDIEAELEKGLRYGNKLIITEKLDYRVDHNPEFAKAWGKAFNEGRLLAFLLEESDELVKKLNDPDDFSYSRSAANIAALIKKYVGIESTWQRVFEKNQAKYQDDTEMQRFLATHQSIGETFLLKVIEKTQGREAALKFIDELPTKNGFDVSQGFSVRIEPSQDKTKVTITFGENSWNLAPETLDDIIQDRDQLDKSIQSVPDGSAS